MMMIMVMIMWMSCQSNRDQSRATPPWTVGRSSATWAGTRPSAPGDNCHHHHRHRHQPCRRMCHCFLCSPDSNAWFVTSVHLFWKWGVIDTRQGFENEAAVPWCSRRGRRSWLWLEAQLLRCYHHQHHCCHRQHPPHHHDLRHRHHHRNRHRPQSFPTFLPPTTSRLGRSAGCAEKASTMERKLALSATDGRSNYSWWWLWWRWLWWWWW